MNPIDSIDILMLLMMLLGLKGWGKGIVLSFWAEREGLRRLFWLIIVAKGDGFAIENSYQINQLNQDYFYNIWQMEFQLQIRAGKVIGVILKRCGNEDSTGGSLDVFIVVINFGHNSQW